MSDSPDLPPHREADRLIYGGLLGLAAAGVIQLSDARDLDLPQLVEVCALAVATPLLAVAFITDFARRAGRPVSAWRDLIGGLGGLAALVGLAALFFHFGTVVGVLFAVTAALGFILVRLL